MNLKMRFSRSDGADDRLTDSGDDRVFSRSADQLTEVGANGHAGANPQLDENDSLTLLAKAGAVQLLDEHHLWACQIERRTVVVGGSSCSAYPDFLDQARTVVHTYAQMAGVPAPVVRQALYGLDAAAVGAAAVAWHEYLRPTHLQAQMAAVTGNPSAAATRLVASPQATQTSPAPAEIEGSV